MINHCRFEYLKQEIVYCIMPRIETNTKLMFHEYNPTLEAEIWETIDSNDVRKLNSLYNKLCKLVDSLEMD